MLQAVAHDGDGDEGDLMPVLLPSLLAPLVKLSGQVAGLMVMLTLSATLQGNIKVNNGHVTAAEVHIVRQWS